ncbi:hypothetical protein HanIR_Chr11g0530381 [Helianthus annuus]|nr:hypothetical protein HanIR_Chr11g0530381 [Helianthus annuus]
MHKLESNVAKSKKMVLATDRGQRTGCTCMLPSYGKLCVNVARNTMPRVTLFIGTLDAPIKSIFCKTSH